MRIFVLIPVFNRLAHTTRVIECLRKQTLASDLKIIVIDDGSRDGTAQFLSQQSDVETITGTGDWWWGGSIEQALSKVVPECNDDDYIVFLNNDTWFANGYIETLVRVSRQFNGAAVGSVIHEEGHIPPLVSIGARININRMAVWDIYSELSEYERLAPKKIYDVDALSGRGTLYPAFHFKRFGTMRPLLLPHYMADYEVAMRFKRNGIRLVVSTNAVVYSPPVYGNDTSELSLWKRMIGKRSPQNIFQRAAFYSLVGSPLQRMTALPRMVYFDAARMLSSWRSAR